MKIELKDDERHNIKIALISLAKQPATDENSMAYLLNLSRKFDETIQEEAKGSSK